jgi:hypothetical protein
MMYDFPMSLVGSNEIEFFVRCEILLVDGKTPCTLLHSLMFRTLDGSILRSLYIWSMGYKLGKLKYLTFMLYKNLYKENERKVVDWGGTS